MGRRDITMDLNVLKNLGLLKKISLQRSDIIRLEMSECLRKIDQLSVHSEKLIKQHMQEEEFAAQVEHADSNLALDAYRTKQKSTLIENTQLIEEMRKSYDALNGQLIELFSEQKSYEITIDDYKKKKLIREKQEELSYFDELSMQRWVNK